MQTADAAAIFVALSSAVRLEIFRLLVRHAPDGMVAGAISTALGITPANLSFHLKTLTRAGLVVATSQGRFQRYRAQLATVQALVGFLTDECCHGNPGQCRDVLLPVSAPPAGTARARGARR